MSDMFVKHECLGGGRCWQRKEMPVIRNESTDEYLPNGPPSFLLLALSY
jgi:hypothetical protein